MIQITIPAIPPSLNRFAGRKNEWEWRGLKAQWTALVAAQGRRLRPKFPYDKSTVKITYRFPDRRRRDPDNYCGKLLLDGLTAAGIIADDSFSHIRLVLQSEEEPGKPQTKIEIEEDET